MIIMRNLHLYCFAILLGTVAGQDAFSQQGFVLPAQTMTKSSLSAEEIQVKFYEAVQSGESAKMFSMMHPSLTKLIDQPVLVAWTSSVTKSLGPIQSINSRQEKVPDIQPDRSVSNANVKFRHGNAISQIETLNGQLIAFKVDSEAMKDWFKGPATTDLYEEIGRTFIRRFLLGEANSAFNMCHPALQSEIMEPVLSEMISTITEAAGKVSSVTVSNTKLDFNDDSQKLQIKYHVECAKADMTCLVTIQFVGMKGHLVAFSFN